MRRTTHLYAHVKDSGLEYGTWTHRICGYPRTPRGEYRGNRRRTLCSGTLNPFARCEGCGDTFGNAISSGGRDFKSRNLPPFKNTPSSFSLSPFAPSLRPLASRFSRARVCAGLLPFIARDNKFCPLDSFCVESIFPRTRSLLARVRLCKQLIRVSLKLTIRKHKVCVRILRTYVSSPFHYPRAIRG